MSMIKGKLEPPTGAAESPRPNSRGDRGQVIVIFAGAMLVFTLLCAAVIDVSWYWTNNLRMQRAADAAALAGVVWLPGDPAQARTVAYAEATKNGYTTDVAKGIVVTADPDPQDDRRLLVSIRASIPTFFARVAGISSFPATRLAKADFILPVPMGSPQQWYGVGNFDKVNAVVGPPTAGPTADTGWLSMATTPTGNWTTPNRADANNNNSFAVSTTATGSAQQWGTFGLTSGASGVPSTAIVDGIQVQYRALITGSGSPTTTCQLQTNLSWDNGSTWTTTPVSQTLTTTETLYTHGSTSSLSAWPRSGSWVYGGLTDANFRVRLTWNKVSCGASRTASVDTLEVRVTYHNLIPGATTYVPATVPVPAPPGEATIPTSQGFWGAIITRGGVRQNGDRYAPAWYTSGGSAANAEYDTAGYDYTVEFRPGASNGRVHLFDPLFCATGRNPAGSGNYGAGDHWTSLPASGGTTNGPVTTAFTLYDTKGTPFDLGDDTVVQSLTYTNRGSDQSGQFDDPADGVGTGDIPTGGSITNCQSDPAHNQWVTMATGLAAGTYRLNVNTSQAGNIATGAENLWSVYVGAAGPAGTARVYGTSRMVAYSNLTGATARQEFYLAQIDSVHAGKTMEIQLFDPGDVGGDATLRIKSPNGNIYSYATFDYSSDSACIAGKSDTCSATGRQSIRASVAGKSSFDNSVITISIPLPSTYGQSGLTPPGELEPGWWKIEYEVGAANDTTTWQVNIRGNPVHLVLP